MVVDTIWIFTENVVAFRILLQMYIIIIRNFSIENAYFKSIFKYTFSQTGALSIPFSVMPLMDMRINLQHKWNLTISGKDIGYDKIDIIVITWTQKLKNAAFMTLKPYL